MYVVGDRTPSEVLANDQLCFHSSPYSTRAEARKVKRNLAKGKITRDWEVKIFKLVEVR